MAADQWARVEFPRIRAEQEEVPEAGCGLLVHHTAETRGGIRENSGLQQNQSTLTPDDQTCQDFTGDHWIRWSLRQLYCRSGSQKPIRVLSLAFFVVLQAAGQTAGAIAAGSIARALANVKSYFVAQASVATELLPYCILGLVAAGVKGAGLVGCVYYQSEITGKIANTVRIQATRRLVNSGTTLSETGLAAALSVRVREFHDAVAQGVFGLIRALAQLVPIGCALIFVSPLLAISGAAFLIPFGFVLGQVRSRWRFACNRAQERQEELHAGVDELVRNLDLWRTCDAGARVSQLISEAGEQTARACARVGATRSAISSGNEILGTLLVVGTLLLVASGTMPVDAASMIGFVTVVLMSYRPLRDLGDARSWLARGDAACVALEAAIGALPADPCAPLGVGQVNRERQVEPKCLEVFAPMLTSHAQPLEFALAPGTLVCLHGPTGCGKTTLLRELLGLEHGSARIRYDGRSLARSVSPWHRPFAWVPQDAPLVTGTVVENITLVGVNERRARDCLSEIGASGLAELAHAEVVGPGGRRLSGGERRLVCIARSLALGAPIILLDEPTEGLDPIAARNVLAALQRVKGTHSLLVVTHRTEVSSIADQVIECERAPAVPQN